jgi:prepilin-type processing-associated H-X9-DG protein
VTFASISDGLSNTLMIGETLAGEHDHIRNVNNWARTNGGGAHCTTIIPINTRTDYTNGDGCTAAPSRYYSNWSVSFGFKSRHSGGANFVMADGSVTFLTQSIDHRVYQLLGCRNDGQPISLP